jgi:hypothetical protein
MDTTANLPLQWYTFWFFLLSFQLKPYVSYKTQDIYQSELTPQKLFDGTIGKDVQDDFAEEKGTIQQIVKNVLKKYENK